MRLPFCCVFYINRPEHFTLTDGNHFEVTVLSFQITTLGKHAYTKAATRVQIFWTFFGEMPLELAYETHKKQGFYISVVVTHPVR